MDKYEQIQKSFLVIETQYNECKREYNKCNIIIEKEKLIESYDRCIPWMKYHKKRDEVQKYFYKSKRLESALVEEGKTHEKQKKALLEHIEKCKHMKNDIEINAKKGDKYKMSENKIKKQLKLLSNEKKQLLFEQSSTQKEIGKSNEKINEWKHEIELLNAKMNENEIKKQLNEINIKLTKLNENLSNKMNESLEMRNQTQQMISIQMEIGEKEATLERKNFKLKTCNKQIEQIKIKMKQFESNENRSELFFPLSKQITQLIEDNKNKFNRIPMGPLGNYITIKNFNESINENMTQKCVDIIHSIFGDVMKCFLVSTSADMELLSKLCKEELNIVVPCIQFAFDNERYNIIPNVLNDKMIQKHSLVRVFEVIDISNSYVFNAIITFTEYERIYMYGTLDTAKKLLSELTADELRSVKCIYTLLESDIYKVKRTRGTISGVPIRNVSHAIYNKNNNNNNSENDKNVLEEKINLRNTLENDVNVLTETVNENRNVLNEYKNKVMNIQNEINEFEQLVSNLEIKKMDLQNEYCEDNEITEKISVLKDNINDEKDEMKRHLNENKERNIAISNIVKKENVQKKKFESIETKKKLEQKKVHGQKLKYDELLDLIKRGKKCVYEQQPNILKQLEKDYCEQKKILKLQENEMKQLQTEALNSGDPVMKYDYPNKPIDLLQNNNSNNNRNIEEKFELNELIEYKRHLSVICQKWHSVNDIEEIKRKFDSIKLRYESDIESKDKCKENLNEMNALLENRKKEYEEMKMSVSYFVNIEFRYFLREVTKQGYDGELTIDYKNCKLDLNVTRKFNDDNRDYFNCQTLSGGERSFTQIALMMALQKYCDTPMCIYDEFDVFMDDINRSNSMKILLKTVLEYGKNRQYIFITPNEVKDMGDMGYGDKITMHKLSF